MTNPPTTTTTTTATGDGYSEPKAARAMVALVVLAEDLPMPTRIRFQGEGVGQPGKSILVLSLRSVADGQAWDRHLGGHADIRATPLTDGTYLDHGPIRWHGWSVLLHACDTSGEADRLDTATTAHLAEIADGPGLDGGR